MRAEVYVTILQTEQKHVPRPITSAYSVFYEVLRDPQVPQWKGGGGREVERGQSRQRLHLRSRQARLPLSLPPSSSSSSCGIPLNLTEQLFGDFFFY